MDTKTCSYCKNTFPLTEEYFYYKHCYFTLKNGERKKCKSFRNVCKRCNGKKPHDKRRAAIMEELGLKTYEEYREHWKRQVGIKNTKYHQTAGLSKKDRRDVQRHMKENPDFVFTTLEEFREHKRLTNERNIKAAAFKIRKYDYGDIYPVPQYMLNAKQHEMLLDGVIANSLGMSVKDVPKTLLEAKRLNILLKRELLK